MANLNFLKYLREEIDSDSLSDSIGSKKLDKNSKLTEKIYEIEREKCDPVFIDEETGKIYKTERGLKIAISRRLNKAKKARKDDK